VTLLGAERSGLRIPEGAKLPERLCAQRSLTGIKRPGFDVDHLPAYAPPKCFHILDRDIFTFIFLCVSAFPGLQVGVAKGPNRVEFRVSFCKVKKGTVPVS
jgi:hypothetical protein